MPTLSLPANARAVPTVTEEYPLLFADLERLVAAPDCYFEAGFGSFVHQLEKAFRAEEEWIEAVEIVTDSSLKEHRELHAEVLRLMHHAQARNLVGDYSLARKVIKLLPEWFNAHVPNVDTPLVARVQASPETKPTGAPAAA